MKTLENSNAAEAKKNTPDVKIVGDGDAWKLLCKASSATERWMKSTKAMQVPGGVVLQVTTQQGDHVAEAVCYVPGVVIVNDVDGGRKLAVG